MGDVLTEREDERRVRVIVLKRSLSERIVQFIVSRSLVVLFLTRISVNHLDVKSTNLEKILWGCSIVVDERVRSPLLEWWWT